MLLPPTSISSGRGGAVTPCPAPPSPIQRPASHASTLHTSNQPPITISFDTTHPSTSTKYSQAHTQLPPKQISTKCTQSHSYFKINSIISPYTHPSNHSNQSPTITPSTHPTPTPSRTWDIPGRLGQPHGSHFTRIQGWIPLPGTVLDAVVYPVLSRC